MPWQNAGIDGSIPFIDPNDPTTNANRGQQRMPVPPANRAPTNQGGAAGGQPAQGPRPPATVSPPAPNVEQIFNSSFGPPPAQPAPLPFTLTPENTPPPPSGAFAPQTPGWAMPPPQGSAPLAPLSPQQMSGMTGSRAVDSAVEGMLAGPAMGMPPPPPVAAPTMIGPGGFPGFVGGPPASASAPAGPQAPPFLGFIPTGGTRPNAPTAPPPRPPLQPPPMTGSMGAYSQGGASNGGGSLPPMPQNTASTIYPSASVQALQAYLGQNQNAPGMNALADNFAIPAAPGAMPPPGYRRAIMADGEQNGYFQPILPNEVGPGGQDMQRRGTSLAEVQAMYPGLNIAQQWQIRQGNIDAAVRGDREMMGIPGEIGRQQARFAGGVYTDAQRSGIGQHGLDPIANPGGGSEGDRNRILALQAQNESNRLAQNDPNNPTTLRRQFIASLRAQTPNMPEAELNRRADAAGYPATAVTGNQGGNQNGNMGRRPSGNANQGQGGAGVQLADAASPPASPQPNTQENLAAQIAMIPGLAPPSAGPNGGAAPPESVTPAQLVSRLQQNEAGRALFADTPEGLANRRVFANYLNSRYRPDVVRRHATDYQTTNLFGLPVSTSSNRAGMAAASGYGTSGTVGAAGLMGGMNPALAYPLLLAQAGLSLPAMSDYFQTGYSGGPTEEMEGGSMLRNILANRW